MKNYIPLLPILFAFVVIACNNSTNAATETASRHDSSGKEQKLPGAGASTTLDTAKYNQLMLEIANSDSSGRWPVKTAPMPLPGAILPFNRIVAYYGNLYSNKMG